MLCWFVLKEKDHFGPYNLNQIQVLYKKGLLDSSLQLYNVKTGKMTQVKTFLEQATRNNMKTLTPPPIPEHLLKVSQKRPSSQVQSSSPQHVTSINHHERKKRVQDIIVILFLSTMMALFSLILLKSWRPAILTSDSKLKTDLIPLEEIKIDLKTSPQTRKNELSKSHQQHDVLLSNNLAHLESREALHLKKINSSAHELSHLPEVKVITRNTPSRSNSKSKHALISDVDQKYQTLIAIHQMVQESFSHMVSSNAQQYDHGFNTFKEAYMKHYGPFFTHFVTKSNEEYKVEKAKAQKKDIKKILMASHFRVEKEAKKMGDLYSRIIHKGEKLKKDGNPVRRAQFIKQSLKLLGLVEDSLKLSLGQMRRNF